MKLHDQFRAFNVDSYGMEHTQHNLADNISKKLKQFYAVNKMLIYKFDIGDLDFGRNPLGLAIHALSITYTSQPNYR